MSEDDLNRRHADRMKARKAARDRMMTGKTVEKGLVIVHTGAGKGKTTAAIGMALRIVGHGGRVGILQFIKGSGNWDTAERRALESFGEQVAFRIMGEGFTWETQDRERDLAACAAAWEVARSWIAGGGFDMVILDELNIALRYDYLDLADVLATLAAKPADLHVVITGRNAPDALIAAADLVTEMTMVKHPFRAGVKAQAGVEF
ncbi:Cob(I)yrinic acid a,c-diamide adenosyltransferase [uncultured Alphaproteobacteria bacterium]|uniref:Corrinoid adenosyltransferase n=1 Tax=uncultured Alphaproteobacteria bacterium TaxID=91750 RepID=A0A212K9C3_9PROT|nr:Cob(I)yrinic acid a,c-diamide adenosyltransferase [uncultured Alphaproteobacteria bacterium]